MSSVNPTTDSLEAAMARHGIELPEPLVIALQRYYALRWEFNDKMNLTRHTSYEKFVGRDLVDSLVFAQFLGRREKILDVGTGAGVPGIILAIIRDDLDVTLCESVGKRARAVAEMVEQLGLDVPMFNDRVEDLLAGRRFDTLVIRAVGRLTKLLGWFKPHWDSFDRLLLLKGPSWIKERGEARHHGQFGDLALRKLASYPLPGTESQSVLLQICPKAKM